MSDRVLPLPPPSMPNAGGVGSHFRALADLADAGRITGYVAVLIRPDDKWSLSHNVTDPLLAVGMMEAAKLSLIQGE